MGFCQKWVFVRNGFLLEMGFVSSKQNWGAISPTAKSFSKKNQKKEGKYSNVCEVYV
jgi:hypothetical protein